MGASVGICPSNQRRHRRRLNDDVPVLQHSEDPFLRVEFVLAYESSKCVTMTSSMKSAHVSIHCWIVEGVQTSRGEHMMEHLMSHSAPISDPPKVDW